jgi:hypothetical protein
LRALCSAPASPTASPVAAAIAIPLRSAGFSPRWRQRFIARALIANAGEEYNLRPAFWRNRAAGKLHWPEENEIAHSRPKTAPGSIGSLIRNFRERRLILRQ